MTPQYRQWSNLGAVSYDYSIGKFEVTADQWAAVTAADANVGNAGDLERLTTHRKFKLV